MRLPPHAPARALLALYIGLGMLLLLSSTMPSSAAAASSRSKADIEKAFDQDGLTVTQWVSYQGQDSSLTHSLTHSKAHTLISPSLSFPLWNCLSLPASRKQRRNK